MKNKDKSKFNNRTIEELQKRIEELEALYQEAQERRLAAERWETLGKAVAALAHRINNLVGIIPVCVQEISTLVGENETVKDDLEMIDRNARYVLELADALLRPFRPSVTGFFDVNLLLNQAVSMANVSPRIEVVTRYEDSIPSISTDKLLIDAFVELITNAVKAMPGGGTLEISTRLVDGKWIAVWFTDTGCGIHEELREKIFSLFHGSAWPEKTSENLGFGLWWVKTFLQQKGGDIVLASSEVAKGTTFVVKLPVT